MWIFVCYAPLNDFIKLGPNPSRVLLIISGDTLTDVSPEAMRAYQDGLGPSFMENHLMVPLTNKDPQTGEFKAFDLSSYNPYAYVLDPIEGFIRELGTTRMSVDEVEGEVYNRIFDASGPLMALIEPFTAETILLEPMFDIWARQGRARNVQLSLVQRMILAQRLVNLLITLLGPWHQDL